MITIQEHLEMCQEHSAPDSWVRKFCKLSGLTLVYSNNQGSQSEGEIDIGECRLDFGHPDFPVFHLYVKDKGYKFKAASKAAKLLWFNSM